MIFFPASAVPEIILSLFSLYGFLELLSAENSSRSCLLEKYLLIKVFISLNLGCFLLISSSLGFQSFSFVSD